MKDETFLGIILTITFIVGFIIGNIFRGLLKPVIIEGNNKLTMQKCL